MTVMSPPDPSQREVEDEDMLVPRLDVVEQVTTQPIEEIESTAENQHVEEVRPTKYTWRIENFSRCSVKRLYSEVFEIDDYKWRILMFPRGNKPNHLSLYIDVADSTVLPYGWTRRAHFSLTVVNQVNSKYSVKMDAQHKFHDGEKDWGFTSFMTLGDFYDPSRGYLVNDTCVIEAEVSVNKFIDNWLYDSKKETGFVGLKNQGATCYMNSLLQTLYHIPFFRKAVYRMPTNFDDVRSPSISLALQCIFFKLQYNDDSVSTKELTKSFGWDTYDAFLQHDVQELNRVLCEKLEEKMKSTVVEGAIQHLFEGHIMNYIECINVDYKSTRKESFYDLQLDVKGCSDVYASFDKYVEVEHLDGENKYQAEQHGLQDAKKGVLFIDFPPVLQLHLKRFEYDFARDIMVKINDRYEFPPQLDLDRDNGKYLSPKADRSVRNLYTLHSVLVHNGGLQSGHYYAFIRPTLSNQWYKFDDDKVTKEDMHKESEELFGGEEETTTGFRFTKHSSAYMLVYIRECDKDKIMCNVDEKDIAVHLREMLKREHEENEQKKKEIAEAHLYASVKVAFEEDFAGQIGKTLYFDLVDHEKVRSYRVQKQKPFHLFKEEVAKAINLPVEYLRFWLWAERQNHTYRPIRPVTPTEESQAIGHLMEVSGKVQNADLKLFLEVEFGMDLHPIPLPRKDKDVILLFFKIYNPDKEELRYAGRLFVKSSDKPADILFRLNQMAGYEPDEDIELYKEIKFVPNIMCKHIDKRVSFITCQLEDGDIVCYQKSPAAERRRYRFPDILSFLENQQNLQVIHFRCLEKPKEDKFCLLLSKLDSYDEVAARVARHLGLDDELKIRFTPHNYYSQQPKPHPLKYRGEKNLLDMLQNNQMTDILYFEVLDMPLPELQGLKTLKVAFRYASKNEMDIHNIRLPNKSTVEDLLDELRMKVQLSHQDAELRLLEVVAHRIHKIFSGSEKIETMNDNRPLRAEEIPEDEKIVAPGDCLVHVYHFMKEQTQQQTIRNFGMPFLLVIRENEILADVKIRIQKKIQILHEEFSKWKFAVVSRGRPEYLDDSDILAPHFQRSSIYVASELYLGLEHSDNALKRPSTANQYRPSHEKAVKIYN